MASTELVPTNGPGIPLELQQIFLLSDMAKLGDRAQKRATIDKLAKTEFTKALVLAGHYLRTDPLVSKMSTVTDSVETGDIGEEDGGQLDDIVRQRIGAIRRPAIPDEVIDRTLRHIARQAHPDTNPDPHTANAFKAVTAARSFGNAPAQHAAITIGLADVAASADVADLGRMRYIAWLGVAGAQETKFSSQKDAQKAAQQEHKDAISHKPLIIANKALTTTLSLLGCHIRASGAFELPWNASRFDAWAANRVVKIASELHAYNPADLHIGIDDQKLDERLALLVKAVEGAVTAKNSRGYCFDSEIADILLYVEDVITELNRLKEEVESFRALEIATGGIIKVLKLNINNNNIY